MTCGRCGKMINGTFMLDNGIKHHPECFLKKCCVCGGSINGVCVNALDKTWHNTCFNCASCRKQLDHSFVEKDNKPYCIDCGSRNMPTTQVLKTPGSNNNSSASDFVNCGACGKSIDRAKLSSITLNNRIYHEECLRCASCHRALSQDRGSNNYVACRQRADGSIMCEKCYDSSYQPPSSSSSLGSNVTSGSGITCAKCRQAITGKYMSLDAYTQFHNECFVCDNCGKGLTNKFFENGGKRTCDNCVSRCATCNKGLSGEYTTALGKKFHIACFRCANCSRALDAEFYSKNGQPMCASCGK